MSNVPPLSIIPVEPFQNLTKAFSTASFCPLSHSPTSEWLPKTKFSPAQLAPHLIPRPACLLPLTENIATKQLTLLTAPPGYGKSTLLASYYFQMRAAQNLPSQITTDTTAQVRICWLSLDEYDNDLTLFWLALISALQFTVPILEPQLITSPMLSEPASNATGVGHIHSLVGTLINAILARDTQPIILLLDECHYVSEMNVYRLLTALLERLPAQMHIVMASRCAPPLPLARLSSRGQLFEYRTAHLVFSQAETNDLLNNQFSLGLTPTELILAHHYTEGWAAGLHFLATALRPLAMGNERATMLAQCVDDSRALAAQTYLYDYLAAEVLNLQSPAVRLFMLQCAILTELTPAHCEAVTGTARAAEQLEDLFQRNLFVKHSQSQQQFSQVPAATRGYRYHTIFGHFLRHRLAIEQPEAAQAIHQRASRLDLQLTEKLTHTFDAQDWPAAIALLSEMGEHLLQQETPDILQGWLAKLPLTLARAEPAMLYLQGRCYLQQGKGLTASKLLEQALLHFAARNDRTAQGKTLVYLAASQLVVGDTTEAGNRLEQAATYTLPATEQLQSQLTRLQLSLASTPAQAQAIKQQLAEIVTTIGSRPERNLLRTLYLSSSFTWLAIDNVGELLFEYSQWAMTQTPPPDRWWQIYLDNQLAWIYWLQGAVVQAEHQLAHGLAHCQQLAPMHHPVTAELVLLQSFIFLRQQEFHLAQQQLQGILAQPQAVPIWVFCTYTLGRAYWEAGQITEARQIYQTISEKVSLATTVQGQMYNLLLGGLLEMSGGSYLKAEEHFLAAVALEARCPSAMLVHSPRVLLAYLYLQWKGAKQALVIFMPLLVHCKQQNRPALLGQGGRMSQALLKAAVRQRATTTLAIEMLRQFEQLIDIPALPLPHTDTHLSRRELVVLQLLAEGTSNRAIAERLNITVPTVKSHITHLLNKLNVTSRQDAVARAHELGLY